MYRSTSTLLSNIKPSSKAIRLLSSGRKNVEFNKSKLREKSGLLFGSLGVAAFGLTFAAVPLYKLYCQVSGKGGQAIKDDKEEKVVTMSKDLTRPLKVTFSANSHSTVTWNFEPLQGSLDVYPGETALAFYRAKNPLDELVIGVATYTVLPYEAGQYFNKIQCFCFEEQMLQPKEDVFMPVLFYIDPEFSKDPQLVGVKDITLNYTFFRSKDGAYEGLDEEIELKKH